MSGEWSREWPTTPGRYWLYGKRSGFADTDMMFSAEVKGPTANDCMVYIVGGNLMYEEEGGSGWWMPLTAPDPPKEAM